MIVISTMTTGWHYFSDVLAGLIIASLSILIAASATRA
jgi:membrane-associated phospholipid phosphatase